MIRASVVIPTYNRRALLIETLAGLAVQTVPPSECEVLVGVDGCTDDTESAVAAFARRTSLNVRAVVGRKGGPAATRNRASSEATAPLLVFIDDDQRAHPDFLAWHLDAHRRWPNAIVQGFYPVAPERLRGGITRLYDRTYRQAMAAAEQSPRGDFTLWGGNFSVAREVWDALGGFDSVGFGSYGCEDADFGLRAVAAGARLVYEPRARTDHLHACGYGSFRRQAREEGTASVRLGRRHGLPPLADDHRRWLTAHLTAGWRQAPQVMEGVGVLLTGGLWLTDRLPVPAAQVAVARTVRKLYLAAGVASAEPAVAVKPVTG